MKSMAYNGFPMLLINSKSILIKIHNRATNNPDILKEGNLHLLIVLLLILAGLFFASCGENSSTFHEREVKKTEISTLTPTEKQTDNVRIALAVTDISVGSNRLRFGLIAKGEGPVKNAPVSLHTYYLDGERPNQKVESLETTYIEWPTGKGGVYTATANFTQKGRWGLGVVLGSGDNARRASAFIEVSDTSMAPSIGTAVPRSITKSLSQGHPIKSITSDSNPYPPLYELTLREALDSALPSLVVFATPAYCRTATCGPQLEIIKNLHKSHRDRINFIHIEIYDNPNDIKGDLSKGIISSAAKEWNLPSEPWTFLINSEGVVIERYEGLVTSREILDILPYLR